MTESEPALATARLTASGDSPSEEFARLAGLYRALSLVSRAILTNHMRDDLFTQICRILVDHGGFGMSWIGWQIAGTHVLVPVASWGDDTGYLRGLEVSTDERPEGRGPSGTAFRDGRPYICNDVLDDPATVPWRPAMQAGGYRASASFPIREAGQVAGTLSVYAREAGFFKAREIALLGDAAADISFALDNLAREAESRRAELGAQNERRFSDTMIESMPGVLYLYDEDGRFLRWNRNFEAVSGYSAAEIAGMHPLDFFAPRDKARLEQRIGTVFEHGEAHVEAPLLSKDGTETAYFLTGKRVVFNGKVCLVGVGIDVSERERAQVALARSEQRYRSTLDSILEGCQLLDFDWRYLYLNDAASVQNRRPNAELLGQRMPDTWPGIEATSVFAMLRRCMEGRLALHEETEFPFPDGSKGWFDVRAQPVPEGIFVLSIDISERKLAERALHELNESLEAKVQERTADLETARERAEVADRLKSAFLATMSHELRTPLNSIIGFTGIVLQELAGPLTAEQRKQLGMVRGSARHLLELINDVLDLSKIEADQLEIEAAPFEPLPPLERVINSVRPQADKKGLTLVASFAPELGQCRLVSDRRRVEQVLLNLLSNAIKFTEHGGVTVTALCVADWQSPATATATATATAPVTARAALQVRVEDTGIGIKPADLSTLFKPFRQIDTGLARQHEGTGLGLAICRRLAALLGGEILASSAWGRGSTFTFNLPMEGAQP